jgi:alcohol dehydrogenase class IV
MQPVTSWSCPTHIVLGSARDYLAALGETFVVADQVLGWEADLVREPGIGDADFVAQIRDGAHGRQVVAVGGGSILDPARVAVAGLPVTGDGPLLVPAAPTASCDIVCVPSTIGTAAEVSPVAVLHDSGTLMLVSPRLRARMAILDPAVTANPDSAALRLGLIEPWARAVVPVVAGDGLRVQDAVALALAEVLEDLTGAAIDAAWRRAAALASIQTHTAFLAVQRPPFSHVLWPVVMEFAGLAGVSKQRALAVLLPGWLESKGRDDLAVRVRTAWPTDSVAVDVDELNARVARRWAVFGAPRV